MWNDVDQYSEKAFKTLSPTKIGMLGFKMNIDCELMIYFEDMCPNSMQGEILWKQCKLMLKLSNTTGQHNEARMGGGWRGSGVHYEWWLVTWYTPINYDLVFLMLNKILIIRSLGGCIDSDTDTDY